MGGECGKKYWVRSFWEVVGGQADVAMCGRMWWYCFRMMECGLIFYIKTSTTTQDTITGAAIICFVINNMILQLQSLFE
jgi:hypothetical protein